MIKLNSFNGIGRLTADPEVRTFDDGKKVCNFTIAIDRPRVKDITDFLDCSAWGQPAAFLGQYGQKGDIVCIVGSVQNSNYEKDGVKHYRERINVQELSIMPRKASDGATVDADAAVLSPEQVAKLGELQAKFVECDLPDGELPF